MQIIAKMCKKWGIWKSTSLFRGIADYGKEGKAIKWEGFSSLGFDPLMRKGFRKQGYHWRHTRVLRLLSGTPQTGLCAGWSVLISYWVVSKYAWSCYMLSRETSLRFLFLPLHLMYWWLGLDISENLYSEFAVGSYICNLPAQQAARSMLKAAQTTQRHVRWQKQEWPLSCRVECTEC